LGVLGKSLRLVWLQTLAQQYKSPFDIRYLWLFHQPLSPREIWQTLDGAAMEKGVQESVQPAPNSGLTSDSAVPSSTTSSCSSSSSSPAPAKNGAGGGVERTVSDEVEGGHLGCVSIIQLRLVVNMLLLLWPQMRSQGADGCQGSGRGAAAAAQGEKLQQSPTEVSKFSLEEQCWDGLLILAALLQQAPAEAKQQLMKDHGTLLLQLLYHVLLDHEAMGKRGLDTAQVLLTVDNLGEVVREVDGSWGQEDRICTVPWTAEPMSVVQLVLMVVQSLVFVVDPGLEHQAGTVLENGLGIALRGGEMVWM
jgi:hypothetical protein